jgi:hypothetical protein
VEGHSNLALAAAALTGKGLSSIVLVIRSGTLIFVASISSGILSSRMSVRHS